MMVPRHHRRVYAGTRRAWTPRLWPVAVVSLGLVSGAAVTLPVWAVIPLTVLIPWELIDLRWRLWRWLNPPITLREWQQDRELLARRVAPWN
jgi:hypothetical protein